MTEPSRDGSEELSQVRQHRQHKLKAIRERGLEPYPYTYDRTHLAVEAISLFDQVEQAEGLDENGNGDLVSDGGPSVSLLREGSVNSQHKNRADCFRKASMNGSRSPSITLFTSPTFNSVR